MTAQICGDWCVAAVRTGPRSSFLVNLNMYEVAGSKPTIVHRPPKKGKSVASIVLVILPTLLYSSEIASPPSTFKVMDVSLVLYAEHDFNASTFTSRVVASTNSDLHSSVCAAIGALKGNLHGGANEAAMDMLNEIMADTKDGALDVDAWMQRAFVEKRKLMGFGHRVYKNGDHRAGILRDWGRKFAEAEKPSAMPLFELGDAVQSIMLRDKNIHPNVDFPCGMTYFSMGIPVPQYTPIFVASRITGWCAHIMEQHANNRIIRPLAEYVGPELSNWND